MTDNRSFGAVSFWLVIKRYEETEDRVYNRKDYDVGSH